MADKVIKMRSVCSIHHEIHTDRVRLVLGGAQGIKSVRVEADLDVVDIQRLVDALRIGTRRQAWAWNQALKKLGHDENADQ